MAQNNITVDGANLTANGGSNGRSYGLHIYDSAIGSLNATVKSGTVTAKGNQSALFYSDESHRTNLALADGSTLQTLKAGDASGSAVDVQLLSAVTNQKYVYAVVTAPPHTHSFTYSADGATITATCGTEGCTLTNSQATLTIEKPTLTTYGETGKSAEATLTGLDAFKTATGLTIAATDIKYAGRDGTSYDESTTPPTNAGKYTAKITLSGVKTGAGDNQSVTASVDYEIAKAATTVTTAPTAGEITYGKTLADSSLTGGTASAAGTFAWKDTTIVPAVSDSQKTEYDVVFTPTDGNYSTAECKVKLTVNKAAATVTAPTTKTLTYTGSAQELVNVGSTNDGTMYYAVTTENKAPADESLYTTSIPTETDAGTYYVWYKVVGDDNHNDSEAAFVEVTINPRPSSSGGGGSSVASYDIVVADGITGGSVKPDRTNVGVGTRVTVTVTPDGGYKLDTLTATDKNDKDVALTQADNGAYTFTMPNSKVTLSATFVSDGSQPTPTPPAPSDSEKFVDVPKDAWYHDSVYWAVDKGITEGVDATHFSPDATCTRAQMVTFLWRAAGEPTPANNVNPFTDVDGNAYYYNAVLWGVDQGIVKGTSETTFSPDATVTRAQTVTFLYRYEQSQGGGFTGAWAFPLNYSDAADVPDWAYEAFCWMTMHNVVQGSDGKLLPNDKCLRSQIVTMLDRYFNSAEA